MLTDPSPIEFQVSVITTFLFLIALLGSLSIVISAPFLIRVFSKSLEGMAGEKINEKWQKFMKPYFDNIDENNPDEAMLELEEVFHVN